MPEKMPNALHELFDLSFPTTLYRQHHNYSHFIDPTTATHAGEPGSEAMFI